MSYDIRIGVKVEGCEKYSVIALPQYDSPTYNLGKMFRACTGWDFKQGEWYKCSDVIKNITDGITELQDHPEKYRKYEPDNGWGTISSAIQALESMRDCICEEAEEIPMECLYVRW